MLYWFHNNTRGSASGSGTRGILKLSATPKLVQPWQAYLNKFQDTRLKQDIESAWQDCIEQEPEGKKPKKTQFEVRNKVAKSLYEQETPEVKQEVEEHRQKMRESKPVDAVNRNEIFQRYGLSQSSGASNSNCAVISSIDKLPHTLQLAMESITNQTGWNVSIIAGGPNPCLGGKITTLT